MTIPSPPGAPEGAAEAPEGEPGTALPPDHPRQIGPYRILRVLLGPERTYPNLFDAHPPFQIDGNFGGTAAIAEMLVQSHEPLTPDDATRFEIELLPTLPKAWPTGSVTGLRARGGFEVDVAWKDGRLVSATLRSTAGGTTRLRYAGATHELTLPAGGTFTWDGR